MLLATAFGLFCTSQGYAQDKTGLYSDSKYVPMCFETHKGDCHEKKNMVFLLSSVSSALPTFSVGYFRIVTPDLAFGLMLDGSTTGGVTGSKFGFSYLFGD